MSNNIYEAPSTNASSNADFELPNLSFPELKRLRNHSCTIQTLAVLWILGILVCGALLIFANENSTLQFALPIPAVILSLVMLSIGVYANFARPEWGRALGILCCALALISGLLSINIFTILIGILGLVAISQGKALYGENRIPHKVLQRDFKRRKKLKM